MLAGLAVAWTPALGIAHGQSTPSARVSEAGRSSKSKKTRRKSKKTRRKSDKTPAKRSKSSCLRELRRLGVRHREVKRRGIDIAVQVTGDIGGVRYRGYNKKPLVLDCSLVVSLAHLGPQMTAMGIARATYSSAFQRRRVRDSDRWSRHSFGLAIDVHTFAGDDLGVLEVRNDYEQGLGDAQDCVGQPLTQGGAILRTLYCQLEGSGSFHSILTPDYDAGHYNHFHVEADPWIERETVTPQPTLAPLHLPKARSTAAR